MDAAASQPSHFTKIRAARQPVCDSSQRTFAYELLFRDSDVNCAVIRNPDQATADVIVNSFMEIGLERMVGGALAFINVTRDFIVGGHCRALPKEKVVLEILEDTGADFELVVELNRLRATGYRFALDDFTFSGKSLELLPFSDFVKVDLRQVDRQTIERELPALLQLNCRLIAEKVETREEFEFCAQRGFDYFQGYFFSRPQIMSAAAIPSNRVALFRLLAELHNPDVSARRLENIVGEDLALSYKLLRYINSAYFGLTKSIESIGHAVRLVGLDQVRMLASLIMLTTVTDKPQELITLSLTRAKMCELMAGRLGYPMLDTFFTVGLFSTLDSFLDVPMEKALDLLPLSPRIRAALLMGEGPLGEVLRSVLRFERASSNDVSSEGLEDNFMPDVYWQAVDWQQMLVSGISWTRAQQQ